MRSYEYLINWAGSEDFKNEILTGLYDIPEVIKYIKDELERISQPWVRWERLGVPRCEERLKIIYELYPEYEVVT